MEGYSSWFQNCFHPINGPAIGHENQGYHMNLKDCLTLAYCLICEIVHVGRQAYATSMEKFDYKRHHHGQYFMRTF